MRRLEVLQWVGLLLGAAMWGAAHIAGYGVVEAGCNSASTVFGIDLHLWEGLINGLSGLVSLGAAAAAAAVIVLTQGISYEDDPPVGRMRFFALAALVANVLFIAMVVLYAVGSIANPACNQA